MVFCRFWSFAFCRSFFVAPSLLSSLFLVVYCLSVFCGPLSLSFLVLILLSFVLFLVYYDVLWSFFFSSFLRCVVSVISIFCRFCSFTFCRFFFVASSLLSSSVFSGMLFLAVYYFSVFCDLLSLSFWSIVFFDP